MRQKLKQGRNDVISSFSYPVSLNSTERQRPQIVNFRIPKQIGHRTKEKIHFKTQTNKDFSLIQKSNHSKTEQETPRPSNVKVTFNYNPE